MAQTPEGRVKDAIKKFLKAKKVWYYMPVQNGMGVTGIPDFICCHHGRFIAIEAKAKGKKGNTSANQKVQIMLIQDAGGVAVVADDVEDIKELFSE